MVCCPFQTPVSTNLSVVSSDYTCLVLCCSPLSGILLILSSFSLAEALFQPERSVYRSIGQRFDWSNHGKLYFAENKGWHKVELTCTSRSLTPWLRGEGLGIIRNARHWEQEEWMAEWAACRPWLNDQLIDRGFGLGSEVPALKRSVTQGFLNWRQGDKRGSWLSNRFGESLTFAVPDAFNWPAVVNNTWFNVVWGTGTTLPLILCHFYFDL